MSFDSMANIFDIMFDYIFLMMRPTFPDFLPFSLKDLVFSWMYAAQQKDKDLRLDKEKLNKV